MKKCPSCKIEPTYRDGCFFCEICEITTQCYSDHKLAEEAWNNEDVKTKEELEKIWKESNKKKKTYYYIPDGAEINLTNEDMSPPKTNY